MEKVGIVTVTYNSENVLEGFLESCLGQTFDRFIIYIIDNNSIDKTLDIINSYNDKRINVINNLRNLGVAQANNQGISAALKDNCTQVLFLNNDVEFEGRLIEKMLFVQEKYNCSLVTPKIMYFDDKDYIWYAGSSFIKSKGFLPIHQGNHQKDYGQFDGVKQVEYAPTCCLLVKKEVFQDIGLMDEKYFVYFDDTDFLYRILRDGSHSVFYFSDAQFFHKVGSLTDSFKIDKKKLYRGDFFLRYNIRNHIYFLKKIGTFYSYLFIIFLFFKNNIKFIINHNIKKDFKTFMLINKSYFDGVLM